MSTFIRLFRFAGPALPDADSTTDAQWRWEFLRRRPDYRKAWVAHFDESQKHFAELEAEGCFGAGSMREFYRGVGTSLRIVTEPFGVENIIAPWRATQAPGNWRRTFAWAMGTPSFDVSIESMVDQGETLKAQGIKFFLRSTSTGRLTSKSRPFAATSRPYRKSIAGRSPFHPGSISASGQPTFER